MDRKQKRKSTKKGEPFIVFREDLEKVLILIREEEKKDQIKQDKSRKIQNMCSVDPGVPCHMRPTMSGGRLTNIQQLLFHLNRSALAHDWSTVAACVKYLLDCHSNLMPVIMKSVFLVLFNHPDSSETQVESFLESLGLKTYVQKLAYLKSITVLPQEINKFKHYVRSSGKKLTDSALMSCFDKD